MSTYRWIGVVLKIAVLDFESPNIGLDKMPYKIVLGYRVGLPKIGRQSREIVSKEREYRTER